MRQLELMEPQWLMRQLELMDREEPQWLMR